MTAAHTVRSDDEGRHTPGPEDLWSESWYCDVVQADGSVGGWFRLGLYPNRGVAWWTAWIVRPGRPGISVANYNAPLPADGELVSGSDTTGRVEIDLVRPLDEFRLALANPAEVFASAEDVYAETPAATTNLAADLTWTTDGVPYGYDVTTRYEIPCLVSGTVTIGAETIPIAGQGQRDHSWGVRDWWAVGWCWCAVRLDDGTRVHLVDMRIPGVDVALGYVQTSANTTALPVTAVSVDEDVGAHGFPSRARVEIAAAPGSDPATESAVHLGIDVVPVAFGPALFRNDDGRISRFPRAMVHCVADDGRSGSGWIEWNQPSGP